MKIENIKFKAKRLDNGEWVEGDLTKDSNGVKIIEHTDKANNWIAVIPSTVCQFTGLKDSKGKEVWEGDMIKDPYLGVERTIEWNNHLCCFNALDEINSSQHLLGAYVESLGWYVVGNKFDKEK